MNITLKRKLPFHKTIGANGNYFNKSIILKLVKWLKKSYLIYMEKQLENLEVHETFNIEKIGETFQKIKEDGWKMAEFPSLKNNRVSSGFQHNYPAVAGFVILIWRL